MFFYEWTHAMKGQLEGHAQVGLQASPSRPPALSICQAAGQMDAAIEWGAKG